MHPLPWTKNTKVHRGSRKPGPGTRRIPGQQPDCHRLLLDGICVNSQGGGHYDSERDDIFGQPMLTPFLRPPCTGSPGLVSKLGDMSPFSVWISVRSLLSSRQGGPQHAVLEAPIICTLSNDPLQAHQRPVSELGDNDSLFPRLDGILVHEKAKVASSVRAGARGVLETGAADAGVNAVHCFHGFGANLYSWNKIQQKLADRIAGVVTAHDMPGFGLTERWVFLGLVTRKRNAMRRVPEQL